MNLFILNKELDPIAILDDYVSLIWTDRYQKCGDFELVLSASSAILSTIKQDYYVWCSESDHTMIVEKILVNSDVEDGSTVTISGRSLESILDRRIIWGLKTLSGNLQNGVKVLLNENVISPSNESRKIDNFVFEMSTDSKITELTIDAQYTGDNLYDTICKICADRGIGFKVTLSNDKNFVFKLYAGTDRSYRQNKVPWVIFSPKFDNLISSNYLESRSSLKNVTLVGGEGEGSERRYTAVGSTTGLDRREMFTDARDISSDISEDISDLFSWTEFPSQVYKSNTKEYLTNVRFNSSTADISNYSGRTVRLSVPKYTTSSGTISNYATILLDANKSVISTVKVWDTNGSTANSGSLEFIEFVLPENAKYIYTSMFSQNAIDNDVYYGEIDDFECSCIKVSNDEYISQLRQRGKEDLAENIEVMSFEGEAETSQMFVYGKDFFNGDVVQVENEYGHEAPARIMEIIMSENEEGSSVYPTFSVEAYESLPKGYLRLSYIQSSGTQHFDTGYEPNQNTRVVMDIEILSASTAKAATPIFGARSTIKSNTYSAWAFSQTKVRSDYGTQELEQAVSNSFERMTIDKNKNACSFGATMVKNEEATFQAPCSLILLGINNDGTVDSRKLSAKFYSCKIYSNDLLVRDFVPVKNDVDVVGLYDFVERKFYKNAGTGAFEIKT